MGFLPGFGLAPAMYKAIECFPSFPPRWRTELSRRTQKMKQIVLQSLSRLHRDEAGQGLVEYLLILALVAFAATAGMGKLASGLNSAFSQISTILGSYIT
jgi:pilus assembly protein Flp/PilA